MGIDMGNDTKITIGDLLSSGWLVGFLAEK